MKRLFYFLIVLSCTLWSCGKSNSDVDDPNNPDNPDTPTNVTLDISTTDLTFEASGGQKEFTIYCNSDWTITNSSSWCKTDVTNGNSDRIITVTADPYSETADQNTNLTIKAGDKTKVLTVTQKHGDAIILTKDKFDVPQEGENITIEVKSNIEYQVSIPSKFQTWIKQAVKSKALETKTFSFTISANEDFDKREGYIVFSGNSLKDTVYVYQAQKNQLILTEDTYNIPAEGKDITVELKTNVDYDVTIPNDAKSWISQITTRAIRTDQLKFHITANDESNNRSAKIVIKDKNSDLSDTLYTNQIANGTYIGDIYLSTEEDLKAFKESGCKILQGNLIIKGYFLTLVTLDNILQEITGDLRIENKTPKFDGLYSLTKIGGNFIIKNTEFDSFEGLNNLASIGGDFIIEMPYDYFDYCTIKSFQGLNKLESIGGSFKFIEKHHSNSILTSFQGLDNLRSINKDFILSLDKLESFEGLESLNTIGGSFILDASVRNYRHTPNISGNPWIESVTATFKGLTSFKGLDNLTSIGKDFSVIAKVTATATNHYHYDIFPDLESFNGLDNLKEIGGNFEFLIHEGEIKCFDKLESFIGLESLNNIKGNFIIKVDANRTSATGFNKISTFNGLNNLKSIGGDLRLTHDIQLTSFEGLNNLISIGDTLSTSISNYQGLSKLEIIGGNLSGKSYVGLDNLHTVGSIHISNSDGLDNLETVINDLEIQTTQSTLPNLKKLKKVGRSVFIKSSSVVTDVNGSRGNCKIENLDVLKNIQIIGKCLYIDGCTELTNLDGLKNLVSVETISITLCPKLYDFCILKSVVAHQTGTFFTEKNGYNPTKYQILNGDCSKQPE